MNTPSSVTPPACEFDSGTFILQVEVLVESKVEAVSPVVNKLMRLLNKTCCPPDHSFAVETALREALANAIVHGNHRDPRKKVRVCCGCDSAGGLLIVVKDEGEGFDPAKIPSPVVGENVYSEHGRGIHLINLLMDKVEFERGGKEIYMRKIRSFPQ
jgi:serine/threonine-protein kinase RsbW